MTERTFLYRPGGWLGIVGSEATVLLPGSEKERAGALWARIDDGAGFDAVLDVLVAGGLSSLPGFVLLARGPEGVRIVIRGEATATFETSDGPVLVSGEAGSLWNERSLVADEFTVVLPGEAADGQALAVVDGLVRLGSLETPKSAVGLAPVVSLTAPVVPIAADESDELDVLQGAQVV